MESRTQWWEGRRGEWYVVGQIALIALVFFGPRAVSGWPAWGSPYRQAASIGGGVLMAAGLLLLVTGIFSLGSKNLTPMPYPRERSTLVESGPYRFVRHPMYSGGILAAFGWAFLVHGWLTIGYAILLLVFADFKSSREEKWLKEKFADYPAYQRRVRKLIPFVY